jgi:CelD/BcsL family acetyltransferase involved in cellulose biosynthesis
MRSELFRLEDEWNSLWLQTQNGSHLQTFSYCYDKINSPEQQVFCITLRDAGELVLVWPFIRYRKGILSLLRPLGPTIHHCSEPLVKNCDISSNYVARAVSTLVESRIADIVNLQLVKEDSHLGKILAERDAKAFGKDSFPYISWRKTPYDTWDDYYNSLSSNYRKTLRKKQRKLSGLGKIGFNVVEDKSQFPKLIDWMLAEKRKWGEGVDKIGGWVFSEEYKDLLVRLTTDESAVHPFNIFTLTLNGTVVAARIAAIAPSQIEWIMSGFAHQYTHCSPGLILGEMSIRWAYDRNLDCDFGPGVNEAKLFWTKHIVYQACSYKVPLTAIGTVTLNLLECAQKIAKRN